MPRRSVSRREILDAASRLLVEEGLSQLTTRRLAREVGASTQVIYSAFEDKAAIENALLSEGFSRLSVRLARVEEADAFAQLRALCGAYRAFATENSAYFRLMWRGQAHEDPSEEASAQAKQAMDALLATVAGVVAALDGPARLIETAAISVWSAIHGFSQLELSHQLPEQAVGAYYEALLVQIEAGLRAQVAAAPRC